MVASAIAGNALVCSFKMTAAIVTGSAAMFAEAIHSLADTLNQTCLAVGMMESLKKPDASHPYGYGNEKYVWALISGVGIFFLGCGVSVYHGILSAFSGGHDLQNPISHNL